MAHYRSVEQEKEFKSKVLFAAAKLFLKKGYTLTSLKEISDEADVNINTMKQFFGLKENILAELVKYVLEGQFKTTENLLKGKTEDKIFFYAAETTLQLHMAESSEYIRDIYNSAYSLPNTTEIIQQTITHKLEEIFKPTLPHLKTKDFFELEIASGGIMRGFLSIPCDMYFTMERKVRRFLETTFKLYDVPQEKIQETIQFVSNFDFELIARQTIESMLAFLEKNCIGEKTV